MAEIRKHDPDAGEGIGRLVREALGETVRPVEPGAPAPTAEPSPDEDEGEREEESPAKLPTWPSADGITFTF